MRIGVVHLTYSWPPMGGSTVDIHEILRRTMRHHEVRLFVPQFPPAFSRCRVVGEQPYPIEKIPFTPFSFNYRTIGNRFRKRVEAFKPDLVFIADGWHLKPWLYQAFEDLHPILRIYTYENLCLLRNGILFRDGSICPRNFLATPHYCHRCTFFARQKAFWYRWEQFTANIFSREYYLRVKTMLQTARNIIVYNQWTADLISPYNQSVSVIPSGVDSACFTASSLPRNEPPIIFAPGRMDDPCKGLSLLIRALDSITVTGIPFQLYVTGAPRVRRPYLQSIGWVSAEEMPSWYRKADLVVVPALWPEPQGIVILEAMASGRPMVATAMGGLKNMIVDGVTGFLTDVNPENLAAKIVHLLSDHELRAAFGAAGRAVVERDYEWDLIYRRHYDPLFS